jgi:hypothetical protein
LKNKKISQKDFLLPWFIVFSIPTKHDPVFLFYQILGESSGGVKVNGIAENSFAQDEVSSVLHFHLKGCIEEQNLKITLSARNHYQTLISSGSLSLSFHTSL